MPAQTWIKVALKDRGLKSKDVANALSIPPPRVTDIFQGRREVQSDEIVPLAGLLGLSTKSLLASLDAREWIDMGADEQAVQLSILGAITGTGDMQDLPDDYPVHTVPVPPDASTNDGLQCYVMGDDSLDQEIKPGALMIAGDIRLHSYAIVPNSFYLVRLPGGGLIVRQLMRSDSGEMWMVPRPTKPNPAYESYVYSMLSADMEQKKPTALVIRPDDIVAGIMWVHQRFTPPRG